MKPYSRRVRYYETDQMGVVHHSNYIRFFEEARTDFWDQVGLDYHKMEQEGLLVPVLACQCRYKKPLRYPQEFRVELRMLDFNGVRFRVTYEIYTDESRHPMATGETEHCFADANLKPVRLAKRYPELLAKVEDLLREE